MGYLEYWGISKAHFWLRSPCIHSTRSHYVVDHRSHFQPNPCMYWHWLDFSPEQKKSDEGDQKHTAAEKQ